MHVEIKHICVPTDFSDAADHAVHYGAALAHQHGADLHLLHILERADVLVHHPDFSAHGEVGRGYFRRLEDDGADDSQAMVVKDSDRATHQFLKTLETGATEKLDAAGQDWWAGLKVRRAVRFGHPVEEICHYANKNGIDMIVMGTHGRSGLSRLLMGSVTERVLRISPCPVVVVRHPEHEYTLVD
jgi:nucleotide-binding universal stress UspA family protein